MYLLILVTAFVFVRNGSCQEYCNITACDFIEMYKNDEFSNMFGSEIDVANEKLLKLERRLRSLEQPGKVRIFFFHAFSYSNLVSTY